MFAWSNQPALTMQQWLSTAVREVQMVAGCINKMEQVRGECVRSAVQRVPVPRGRLELALYRDLLISLARSFDRLSQSANTPREWQWVAATDAHELASGFLMFVECVSTGQANGTSYADIVS